MKSNSESQAQYLGKLFDLVLLRERNLKAWQNYEHDLACKDSFLQAFHSDKQPDTKLVSRSLFLAFSHKCGAVCRIPGRQYGDLAYCVVTNQRTNGRIQIGPEWYTLDGAKTALLNYVKKGFLSE